MGLSCLVFKITALAGWTTDRRQTNHISGP